MTDDRAVYAPPFPVKWDYDRTETLADAAVHLAGIAFAVVAGVVLCAAAAAEGWAVAAAAGVYSLSLVVGKTVSAVYNLWPASPTKWRLRRLDHAAIFALIAGTYTPFLSEAPACTAALLAVWTTAFGGMTLKLLLPGRYERTTIGLYLALGWSGIVLAPGRLASLDQDVFALMLAGGLTYTAGVFFHVRESMRFQNAVWHGFVLVASVLFYAAVRRNLG